MDRMLYTVMNGAINAMHAQQTNANNLANINTTGFKADLDSFESLPVYGPGYASRAFANDERAGTDFRPGSVITTGAELDVMINHQGWFVVQDDAGQAAYSRRGDFHTDATGLLLNGANQAVQGEAGPIILPEYESLVIAADGTISIRPAGQAANALVAVDRLLLVNPPAETLQRGEDGLFRAADGQIAAADANVKVTSGALEGSNVSSVDAMVKMIEYARFYEMQVKMMASAQQNDESSARLMRMSG